MRKEEFNMKNQELREQKRQAKKTRLSKKGMYLLTLITLFLIAFSATAFIIINANKLTFSGGNSGTTKEEVDALKEQILEKDRLIEELTGQLSSKKSSSFSPPPAETAKPKAFSTPKPSASPSSSTGASPSPSPSTTPKPSPTGSPKSTAAATTPTATPKPTIKPTATPNE